LNRRINMRPVVFGVIMVVLLLIFMPTTARASSDIELILNDEVDPKLEEIVSKYHHQTIQAWHHSGGYWQNLTLGIKVDDDKLGGDLDQLERYIIPEEGYPFEMTLPYEVVQAMNEGKKVVAKVESSHPGFKLEHIMKDLSQPEKYKVTISGNKMKILMHPAFNYETKDGLLVMYQDKGIFTKVDIPFVKQMFGKNGFSLYTASGGYYGGDAAYSNYADTAANNSIVPSIMNADGTLHAGYMIDTEGHGSVPSSSIRIGQSAGVFQAGGAFGLSFNYPLNFRFFVEGEGKSDIVMRELELIDENGKVIESFRRNIDPADPFNPSKQTLIRTSTSPEGASVLDPEKIYKLRAKYQFISFAEGAFDLNDLSTMTPEQRAVTTEVNIKAIILQEK